MMEALVVLAHALGALRVGQLGCEELWRACLAARPAFPQAYLPYHHFRSKVRGWEGAVPPFVQAQPTLSCGPRWHSPGSSLQPPMQCCTLPQPLCMCAHAGRGAWCAGLLMLRHACMARGQGWLVRPGINYGADYVLYNDHPSAAHASFCVLALSGRKAPELLAWADVEAINRVATQVRARWPPQALRSSLPRSRWGRPARAHALAVTALVGVRDGCRWASG